jgi:hypothetical protein
LKKNKKNEDQIVKFTKVTYFDDNNSSEIVWRNILCFNHYIFIGKFEYLSCLIRIISNCVINILINSVKLIIFVYIL